MALPAVLRFSLRICSSKMTRRSSIFILPTSSASVETTIAVNRRAIESSARSASSLEKGFWCAQRFRTSINSFMRLRSALPRVFRNTSDHERSIITSKTATSSNGSLAVPPSRVSFTIALTSPTQWPPWRPLSSRSTYGHQPNL